MNEQVSLKNIDRSVLQFVLHIQELSREKDEINQQIEVHRASIAEKKTHIETTRKNIDKLEEEIMVKQNIVMHYKANAQRLEITNNLLLQFEQTLKEELEKRQAAYSHDMKVFEETIARNKETFQSHKKYFYQGPLAQKLLELRAEKEEIDSRIKACDDEISMKRKELECLTAVGSSSMEQPPDTCLSVQKPSTEPEKQPDPQTMEDGNFTGGIPSPHVNQTQVLQDTPETSVEVGEIHDEIETEATNVRSPQVEEASNKLCPGQIWQEVMQPEEQNKETTPEDQEQVFTVPATGEAVEQGEMEVVEAAEEETAPSAEDNKGPSGLPQASPQSNPESSPVTGLSSTPVLPFSFSPGNSPHKGSSEYPSFLFSLNSEPSTPSFSGFKFDVHSTPEEDSSFPFTGSFFSEKKTADSKSSGCPEFLFSEQNDDFQFTFKSPQTTNKENSKNDLPFSFNF